MDEDLFKQVFGPALQSLRTSRVEDEDEIDDAKERQRVLDEKKKQEEENKKSPVQKMLDGIGDFCSRVPVRSPTPLSRAERC